MSFEDRLKELSYTSPSGKSFTFQYEGLERSSEKKTSEFLFPEKDGAFIQDLGRAGRKFPFNVFFTGEDYDEEADDFFDALEEKGIGTLIHPRWGTRKVVSTGSITQKEELATEVNQASFSFTLSETLELVFPISQEDSSSNLNVGLSDFNDKAAADFSKNVNISDITKKVDLKKNLLRNLTQSHNILKAITKINKEINTAYKTVKTAYENNIQSSFSDMVGIARQAISIIRFPAKVATDIKTKIQAYKFIMRNVFSGFNSSTQSLVNIFHSSNLNSSAGLMAANESVLYYNFKSRKEAIETSEALLTLYDELKSFQDSALDVLNNDTHETTLSKIDTEEMYASVLNVISSTTSYLLSLGFSLPVEKRIILSEDRQLIELTAELYGDLSKIDKVITDNNLTADQIELLPEGTEVIYYQ